MAVDFDGTCVTHEFPEIGRYIGAEPVLQRLVGMGARLVLNTMRSDDRLDDAVKWFAVRKLPLFGVNCNPDQRSWTKSPKVYAQLYIDDAAIGVPLCAGLTPDERPYVDWDKVAEMLFPKIEEEPK